MPAEMPAPVYSEELYSFHDLDTIVNLEAAVGRTVIIKKVLAFNGPNVFPAIANLDILGLHNQQVFYHRANELLSTWFNDDVWYVVCGGSIHQESGIQIVPSGAKWDVSLTGYVLEGEGPLPWIPD